MTLQQTFFDQRIKPPRQHVGSDIQALLEFIEAGQAIESVAQDQDTPPFTNPLQAAGNRALHAAETLALHGGYPFQILVTFTMIATLEVLRGKTASACAWICPRKNALALQRRQVNAA